ncbi:MAG: prephenate dehydrogenase [Clostridia bacterium]|nr:prephenate dehydrogenase [Clostridia bacterium]
MIAGVVGLGLIGGSLAKAYSEAGHTVYAYDTDMSTQAFAEISGAIQGKLDETNIDKCDIILICVYPQACIDYMNKMGEHISKGQIVIDCCGTKRGIVEAGMELAKKYGFIYLGGHPMAGTQYSGFKYARSNLFKGAPLVIVPPVYDDIMLLEKVKELLSPAGFGRITVTTAEKHDEMIAFTSQLAHIVSNAYVKSPNCKSHKGFSAGSYKDMTRVAWLNPGMWTELCLDNKDYVIKELEVLIKNLNDYKVALENNDKDNLVKLFAEGKKRKEEVDG